MMNDEENHNASHTVLPSYLSLNFLGAEDSIPPQGTDAVPEEVKYIDPGRFLMPELRQVVTEPRDAIPILDLARLLQEKSRATTLRFLLKNIADVPPARITWGFPSESS